MALVPPEGSGPQQTNESPLEKTGELAVPEQEYDGRVTDQEGHPGSEEPDVTLDVPSLNIEELTLDAENLRARISLLADLADMVKLNVGVEASIENPELELKGVEAQALLKANLDNVRAILSKGLETLDNNPGILKDVARIAEETAGTAERALEGAAGEIGEEPDRGTDGDTGDQETEEEDADGMKATDAARRKAEELSVDLSQVEATGAGGRILVGDVKKAAKQSATGPA
jgi:pyruvate/2-oxoglutarate dehydrogenase complex dihydrolipoamide acyltransferase (E2) component